MLEAIDIVVPQPGVLSSAAGILRCAAGGTYLLIEMANLEAKQPPTFLGRMLNFAIYLTLLGLLTPTLIPWWRVAGEHVTLVAFSLIVFTVATRVIFGHSGQQERFQRPLPFMIAIAVLLVIALATRVSADFLLSIRVSHLIYAALLWLLAALLWAVRVLPASAPPTPTKADPPSCS